MIMSSYPACIGRVVLNKQRSYYFSKRDLLHKKNSFYWHPSKPVTKTKTEFIIILINEEKKKNAAELTRLLYVACTRAKQSLHLLGILNYVTPEEVKSDPTNSLLGQLWPLWRLNHNVLSQHR